MTNSLFSKMEGMMEAASTPEQIAAVVYEAATDGKKKTIEICGRRRC